MLLPLFVDIFIPSNVFVVMWGRREFEDANSLKMKSLKEEPLVNTKFGSIYAVYGGSKTGEWNPNSLTAWLLTKRLWPQNIAVFYCFKSKFDKSTDKYLHVPSTSINHHQQQNSFNQQAIISLNFWPMCLIYFDIKRANFRGLPNSWTTTTTEGGWKNRCESSRIVVKNLSVAAMFLMCFDCFVDVSHLDYAHFGYNIIS